MRRSMYFSGLLIALTLLVSMAVYPLLPDMIASHWNAKGEVDGYMSKFWGLFLFPLISVLVMLLAFVLPKMDPLKSKFKDYQEKLDLLIMSIVTFLSYVYLLTVFANTGHRFDMTASVLAGVGFLLIYLGRMMKDFKQNWFMGIRTPWTISSEVVWKKTHALASKLFIASGIITLFGVFFPNYAILLLLIPIVASVVWLFIYSFLEYKKL